MKTSLAGLAAALALLLSASPALAGPSQVSPAITATKGRAAEHVKLDDLRKPSEILAFADFAKGDTIVDLMPGTGYYSELLSRVVGPKGTILAVEPAPSYDNDKARAAWQRLVADYPNVQLMPIDFRGLALAPDSVDGMMLHMVFHDLYWQSEQYKFPRLDVAAVLANFYRAVRPGGTVVVVDHVGPAGDTRDVVEKFHRIDPQTARSALEAAGFVFDGESDVLINTSDDMTKSVFDPAVRGKTSRFAYRFKKPE
ncbi:class I SAM-dependent methyltransferase [Flavisphingopyxis soli]|nr:methyltransferase domain-containing protein [Sphingorhabdus soli]